jgi:hypothetical protein
MARYVDVNEERLTRLHDGLDLLEMVDRDGMHSLDLYLYGLSKNPQLLDAAREAIADSEELDETDIQLSEIAVAIPLGADTIYALMGSGIRAKREDFAYLGGAGEGVRTMSFAFGHFKPQIALSSFSKMALASSDSWLDDFLRQEGTGQQATITPAVHRNQEATQPAAPVAPAQPQRPAAPTPAMPKQTSLRAFLDDFLD